MNNYQWLLQMDGAERKAWFDAEHVETEERALDGDTEPENEDSREQLEADAFAYLQTAYITYPQIIELLDRQAAITEQEVEHDLMKAGRMAVEVERERIKKLTAERDKLKELNEYHALQYELASEDCDRLQVQVDELTAEHDNWKANCEDWKKDCERYRSKFGKCLDYADAIHALMDDEGMA